MRKLIAVLVIIAMAVIGVAAAETATSKYTFPSDESDLGTWDTTLVINQRDIPNGTAQVRVISFEQDSESQDLLQGEKIYAPGETNIETFEQGINHQEGGSEQIVAFQVRYETIVSTKYTIDGRPDLLGSAIKTVWVIPQLV